MALQYFKNSTKPNPSLILTGGYITELFTQAKAQNSTDVAKSLLEGFLSHTFKVESEFNPKLQLLADNTTYLIVNGYFTALIDDHDCIDYYSTDEVWPVMLDDDSFRSFKADCSNFKKPNGTDPGVPGTVSFYPHPGCLGKVMYELNGQCVNYHAEMAQTITMIKNFIKSVPGWVFPVAVVTLVLLFVAACSLFKKLSPSRRKAITSMAAQYGPTVGKAVAGKVKSTWFSK